MKVLAVHALLFVYGSDKASWCTHFLPWMQIKDLFSSPFSSIFTSLASGNFCEEYFVFFCPKHSVQCDVSYNAVPFSSHCRRKAAFALKLLLRLVLPDEHTYTSTVI